MITKEMVEQVLAKLEDENKNKKEVINIKVVGVNNDLSIFNSHFNGVPYLPKDAEVPVNKEGEQLSLLAQINCSELPENNIYLKEGILQFWIDGSGDIMGLDFDNPTSQDGNRVVYYKDVDKSITKEDVLSKYNPNKEDLPFGSNSENLEIAFSVDKMSNNFDVEIDEEFFVEKFNSLYPDNKISRFEDLGKLADVIYGKQDTAGHHLGGYPFFTQYDPRNRGEYEFLLFQMDSEWYDSDKWEIMWGDAGVANFFIDEEKFRNLDFSDVLYNWDCY